MSLDDIRDPIDLMLRSVGFRAESKRLWDRQTQRVMQVVHLDKPSYDLQNKLEVFFGLNELVDASKYKLGDFDVRLNFDRVVENAADFRSALDQESIGMPSDIRAAIIQEALRESLGPILNLAIDGQGIRKLRTIYRSKNDLFISPRTAAIITSATQPDS